MLRGFADQAQWLQDTYGGPLVLMATTTRQQLEGLHDYLNAPATEDSLRFGVMELLEKIVFFGKALRKRGRTAYALPTEALGVLLRFIWGQPTDQGVLRRAVEAAKELESQLGWKWLKMPLTYPHGDPFALGLLERDD
jgi:hypothetical protein